MKMTRLEMNSALRAGWSACRSGVTLGRAAGLENDVVVASARQTSVDTALSRFAERAAGGKAAGAQARVTRSSD
jgi:hypothetical protein